jgi:hypothetical protein
VGISEASVEDFSVSSSHPQQREHTSMIGVEKFPKMIAPKASISS